MTNTHDITPYEFSETVKLVEFYVDGIKRIGDNSPGNFEGDTSSCGIMINGQKNSIPMKDHEIGDTITIDGLTYKILSAPNHNVKLAL